MSNWENLSISDTKSLLDFVDEQIKEYLIDLKDKGIKSMDDRQFNELDKLRFRLHSKLFFIVQQLIKEIQ